MSIDVLDLVADFRVSDDVDNGNATFRTRVPWVGPEAYLHIIYKPAPQDVLRDAIERLRLPVSEVEFLQRHNGGRLFSGALGSLWSRSAGNPPK